jgi:hypothetical protein
MGYANYTVYRNGQKIEAGYGVPDNCNDATCGADIDRGLDFLCGATPGGDEYGCGRYFCSAHLYTSLKDGEPQRCPDCYARAQKQSREEFCEQLLDAIRKMDGVNEADIVVDEPKVFIDLGNGDQFVLTVD